MDKIIGENSNENEKFPRSDKIIPGSDGWLSPKGNYYKVGTTQHDESASFLISNSFEAQDEEKRRFRHSYDREDYDVKNDREKLKQLGWILVRGEILRSEDALNFTTSQLKAISEAGIKVISAFDGSTEYSSDEVSQVVDRINSGFAKSKIIQHVREDLEQGKFSPWLRSTRERTIQGIEDFSNKPFGRTISTDELYTDEPEVLPSEIFNVMSEGSFEEMKMKLGRSEYTFRVIQLKTGAKIWVEREEYFHDGLSGGMMGDCNNYISMYVVDNVLMKERLKTLIDHRGFGQAPEIKFETKDGYFADIFRDIVP